MGCMGREASRPSWGSMPIGAAVTDCCVSTTALSVVGGLILEFMWCCALLPVQTLAGR